MNQYIMNQYIIYTDEIAKVHNEYIIIANSKEEAIKKFEAGQYEDINGDIFDSEVVDFEIYEN